VLMPRPDPIQERILDALGVTPLVVRRRESESEAAALVSFLERLGAP